MTLPRNRFGRFLPAAQADPFDPRFLFDQPPAPQELPLSWPGARTVVDAIDLPLASRVSWQAHVNDHGKVYARATTRIGGRKVTFYLHRLIACRVTPPPTLRHTLVDHRNGDSLLNRRSNLRWATPAENTANVRGCGVDQESLWADLEPMPPDHPDNPCTPLLRLISQLERG